MTEEQPDQPDVEPVPEPPVEQQTHGPGGDHGDEERPDDEERPNG